MVEPVVDGVFPVSRGVVAAHGGNPPAHLGDNLEQEGHEEVGGRLAGLAPHGDDGVVDAAVLFANGDPVDQPAVLGRQLLDALRVALDHDLRAPAREAAGPVDAVPLPVEAIGLHRRSGP